MALKVMIWNIQDLSLPSKFVPNDWDPNLDRLFYILQTVQALDPAIISVLEVEAGQPLPGVGRGAVIGDTTGGPAVRLLLLFMQVLFNDAHHDWRLVPPILTGTDGFKEGVAVFFNNSLVNFAGPNMVETWQQTGKNYQVSTPVGNPATPGVAYLAPWDQCLPATVPAGPAIGTGYTQNQLAGKAIFAAQGSINQLEFPNPNNRAPFLTQFRELATGRTINLLSFHAPTTDAQARDAVTNIMRIAEITTPLAATEVRIIAGDWNLNTKDPDDQKRLAPLTATNIPKATAGTTNFIQLVGDPSVLKSTEWAFPGGFLPYLNYISTGRRFGQDGYNPFGRMLAIDNMYVAYGTDPTSAIPAYVCNRVVGTPMIDPVIPEGMRWPIRRILDYVPPAPVYPSRDELFQMIFNYGKIRGASDHMAVMASV